MSRFPELFKGAIDLVIDGEALLVEVLAERIASASSSGGARFGRSLVPAAWPIRRRTPVTGLKTQEMMMLYGIATASRPAPAASSASKRTGSTRVHARRGSSATAQTSAC